MEHAAVPTTNPTPPTSTEELTAPAVWTEQRIRALGAVTDLPTAGRIFGLGRAMSYELARTDRFPTPVIRVGSRYRVPVAAILATLGLSTGGGDLTTPASPSVDHHHEISSPDPLHTNPEEGEP
jgi:hypothetical protein